MNIFFILIFLLFLIIVIKELFEILINRPIKRIKYFNLAEKTSYLKNKPLMVIGDPNTGNYITRLLPTYQCGDICVDITGCPSCNETIKGKIEDILPTLKSNSYVIFLSCVLEFVDNINSVVNELQRVSGGDIFIVYVKRPFFISKLIPGYYDKNKYFSFKNIILEAPPEYKKVKYKIL